MEEETPAADFPLPFSQSSISAQTKIFLPTPLMNPFDIIDKYYTPGPLRDTLIVHSTLVKEKALECAAIYKGKTGVELDTEFISEAAMLHDLGIFRCNAPDIYCMGNLPYICHGVEGSRILQEEGLPRHALVCERHTGSGLSVTDIQRQHLPLPLRDMLPVSLEEKAICYADKFFSKSGDISRAKPLKNVIASMERHGSDTLERFLELHSLFSEEAPADE